VRLSSPAFADGSPIPAKYACEGKDISPPLVWSDIPDGAMSLSSTQELGPTTHDTAPDETNRRCRDDADDGLCPADQGNVDRELIAP
jgi:hypothetical protein